MIAGNIKLKMISYGVHSSIKGKYFKEFSKAADKLIKFFPTSPSLVEIHLFSKRGAFAKKIKKKKIPNWLMGYTPISNPNKIFIYTKDSRLLSSIRLKKLVRHELAHVFTNQLNPTLPTWIKEGLAVYLAKQIIKPSITKRDWKFIKPNKNYNFFGRNWNSLVNNHRAYNNSGLVVQQFIKSYGQKNFLNVLTKHQTNQDIILSLALSFKKTSKSIMVNLEKLLC